MSKTQVVLLGTGTPNAEPYRSGPSVAIVTNETPYIVDFGPGVVRRAVAAYESGIEALQVRNLNRAFATHLHSDHTVGFPDLIFTPWVLGRDRPLEVYGPPGIKHMTDHILEAYKEDMDVRIHGLEHANPEGCRVHAHEIEPGVIYEDRNVTVKAFPVKHGSWEQAFGYRFETRDRTIVISGDAAPTPGLADNYRGCDVLIHEVYSQSIFDWGALPWQSYHSSFHTSSVELAKIAAEVKPGIVILYHQLLWGSSEKDVLKEIRSIYKGKVGSGKDLEVY